MTPSLRPQRSGLASSHYYANRVSPDGILYARLEPFDLCCGRGIVKSVSRVLLHKHMGHRNGLLSPSGGVIIID
jgi:hypothetical protein